jgi:hypothetical protein
MVRPDDVADGHRRPRPRPPLPVRATVEAEHEGRPTHADLLEALHAVDGLVDVTGGRGDRPNFHLRHKPFLHFHTDPDSGELYADVKLGGGPTVARSRWCGRTASRATGGAAGAFCRTNGRAGREHSAGGAHRRPARPAPPTG